MTDSKSTFLRVKAVRWVSDEPFPGIVEVELIDGKGRSWRFEDKYPMFLSKGILSSSSSYPVDLKIACTVIERDGDQVVVSTADPWGLEAVDGTYEFMMQPMQILDEESR